jgi:hypothetical protein
MSEFYTRKEIFWTQSKKNDNAKIILFLIIITGLVLILITHNIKHSYSQIPQDNNVTNLSSIIIPQNKTLTINKLNHTYLDEIITCKDYMNYQHTEPFSKTLASYFFFKCIDDDYSKDIENYYNHCMNGKAHSFKFESDIIDDIKRIKGINCFSSGKSYLALQTKHYPKCIEFKNLNVNNFNKTDKSDPEIIIKIYIYNIKLNKIHLHTVKKITLTQKLIRQYTSYNNNDEFFANNIAIYNNNTDKFLRICNLLPELNQLAYENKFWFEIAWNPEIQNLLCYEKFKYIN